MKLVIVESPAKAKTISKYLGEDFQVDASGGHIRDLPEKGLGVDVEHNFEPEYEVTQSKKETIKRLQQKIKKAETVYLATDPDREGEAISWHLEAVLKLKGGQKNRIVFNEITKKAVQEAIKNPREIDINLVNAQQARRVLDRLVGYKVSPILCKKIKPKLSAGRVQSAALKIMVDREREILAFKPEEYWNVTAFLFKEGNDCIFKALLIEKKGKKFKIANKDECDKVLSDIKGKAYAVDKIKKSRSLSMPPAPFITSTLQQEANSKLNMSSKITMMIAQNLYEGVDIPGEGHTALVTYIRTDSTRIALEAQIKAKEYLVKTYGADYAPEKFNVFKTKKNAQDAHEAIRPISLDYTPESLKGKISQDQYRLYRLIYERFLASQSTPARFDVLTVDILCTDYTFRATGKTMIFDGYTRIYAETRVKDDDDDGGRLPDLSESDRLTLEKLIHEQKFTKPPARFTESSLVKVMEENGIGRPSTYASIISTLYAREYTALDKKSIVPTSLGFLVTEYLEKNFDDIVDIDFTALMESKLDLIEDEGTDWTKIISDFYTPFSGKVNTAYKFSQKVIMPAVESDEVCEKCGAKMLIKEGRYGKFLSCSKYPECSNARPLDKGKETDEKCEKCGAPMIEKNGKYGKYLACSNYPDCKNNRSLNKPVGKCPQCDGGIIKRTTAKGRVFYGCSNYPKCGFVSWELPAPTACAKCGGAMHIKNENGEKTYKCASASCGYTIAATDGDS